MSSATAGELRAAACLRLLSLALTPPSQPRRAAVVDLARALADAHAEVADGVDVGLLAEAFEETPLERHLASYDRLFGRGVALAPYESSYERDPFRQARVLSDVAGFYSAFGAGAHGPASERPDHGGAELEFLGLLSERRVAALEAGQADDAERIREIEDAFLVDHAGRWLPGFFRAIADADPAGALGAVGIVGEQVIVAELVARGLGELASRPLARAPRTSVELDEVQCAADVSPQPTVPGAGMPPL